MLALLERALAKPSQLLAKEKTRRGVPLEQVVFIGMHNAADYKWCGMASVLRSRANERMFFSSYLEDRVRYALELGLVSSPPRTPSDLLDIGGDVDWGRIWKRRHKNSVRTGRYQRSPHRLADVSTQDHDPLAFGNIAHLVVARRYPTLRWNFAWREYVVVGVPDGMGKDFVYEFKTAGSDYLAAYSRPVAAAQADLYGLFFEKQKKVVEFYVRKTGKLDSAQGLVVPSNALELLEAFRLVDRGEASPAPPAPWKCSNCEFRPICPLHEDGSLEATSLHVRGMADELRDMDEALSRRCWE